MYILGISAYYHDSAACLVHNGVLVAAAQEERFSRKKHDHRFPTRAIEYCLREANITKEQLDHVVFYDKPWIKFERLLETYLTFAPKGFTSFVKAMPLWLKEKLWMKENIKKQLDREDKVLFVEHHYSHAASAFYPSPFEEAAILTIDGVGEWATATWGIGKGNEIILQNEMVFPHSIGLLYSAFTYYTGFRVNSGEYKIMGLAPYGEPKYVDLIKSHLIDIKDDGSFRMDMKYFNYCQGLTMTSKKFHDLFGGPPRQPESDITQKEMDLARSVQEITEEIVLKMARHIRKETGLTNLCMAGGVALNCVANGKIMEAEIFEKIWIQPAAGDAGGALGAALQIWHDMEGKERVVNGRDDLQQGSLLGPRYENEDIGRRLDDMEAVYTKFPEDDLECSVAKLIEEGNVVGWFQERMEFGPRALGARSILGDPRDSEIQTTMNLKIKYRESFRPFAPSALAEKANEYFDLKHESPYMLLVTGVQGERRNEMTEEQGRLFGIEKLKISRSTIPAVTHVDYSARVQTVDGKANPRYYKLISEFEKLTSCPVLVNTSFNVRGEPIVCTPEDAFLCFMRTGMDVLCVGDYLMLKKDQKEWKEEIDWKALYPPD